jgi:hypothetical protein
LTIQTNPRLKAINILYSQQFLKQNALINGFQILLGMVALNTQKQNAWTNEIFVGGGRELKLSKICLRGFQYPQLIDASMRIDCVSV